MELAIIAAGTGSRLKEEGINISKPLVKIQNIPLIKRLISSAVKNGVIKVNCIINEESPDLKEFLLSNDFGCEIELIIKSTPSSLHSFMELAPMIKDNHFCLATADSVFIEDEFNKFFSYSVKQDEFDGVLAVTSFVDDEKPLFVEVDENLQIKKFSDVKCEGSFVTGGLYFFSSKIFDEIGNAVSNNMNHLRNYFRLLLSSGYKLKAFEFSKIVDVDHLSDIKTAEDFLAGHQNKISI